MTNSSVILELKDGITENTVIWKYFNFSSFVSLLVEQKLVFRRLDLFSDKRDGSLPESIFREEYRALLQQTDEAEARVIALRKMRRVEDFKKHSYANCWTINDFENYALWKIYLSPEKNGLAIKTTIGKLKKSIDFNPSSDLKISESIVIKDVSYDQLTESESSQNNIMAHKNPEYSYESELRLLIKNQWDWTSREKQIVDGYNSMPVLFIRVDLNELIESLYVSPFSEYWFEDIFKKLIKDKWPDLGHKIRFSKIEE